MLYWLFRFDLKLLSTQVGNFSVSLLEASTNLLVNSFLIPVLNRKHCYIIAINTIVYILCFVGYANVGIVIPVVDGLTFVGPQLTLGQVKMKVRVHNFSLIVIVVYFIRATY